MILVSFGFSKFICHLSDSKFIRTSFDTGKHATVTVGEASSGLNAEYRKTFENTWTKMKQTQRSKTANKIV